MGRDRRTRSGAAGPREHAAGSIRSTESPSHRASPARADDAAGDEGARYRQDKIVSNSGLFRVPGKGEIEYVILILRLELHPELQIQWQLAIGDGRLERIPVCI